MSERTGQSGDPKPNERRGSSGWSKYRLPVILAIIAVCLYALSIYWIIHQGGPVA